MNNKDVGNVSLQIIKTQVQHFLATVTPEAMAIRGAWGVGKTYSWNVFLNEFKNQITLDKYAYVSLFGINSLEELKYQIFENVVSQNLIGSNPNLDTLKTNTKDLLASFGRKSLRFAKSVPTAEKYLPPFDSLAFFSLRNTIVCLDDFERKGDGLTTNDILGLISMLKEQRGCKVVLIMNDEKLEEEHTKDYQLYREKVVDIELSFNPTSEEALAIAIDGEDVVASTLREDIQKLGICNIRIIKKMEHLARLFVPVLSEYEAEVTCQILHSLCLFVWCHYGHSEGYPTIEYLRENWTSYYTGQLDEGDKQTKEKVWDASVRAYGFKYYDELDDCVAKAVQFGYVDEGGVKKVADELNRQVISGKASEALRESWSVYHNSFESNQDDVVSSVNQSFCENIEYLSVSDLDGAVKLFRELRCSELADELIELFIVTHRSNSKVFNLSDYHFSGRVTDSKIVDRFNEIAAEEHEEKTIQSVLQRIAGKDGWNQEDEVTLANATVEAYYNLFKELRGDALSATVDTCLKFGRFTGGTECQKKIGSMATEALKRIGTESPLNALRIRKFGVQLQHEECNE